MSAIKENKKDRSVRIGAFIQKTLIRQAPCQPVVQLHSRPVATALWRVDYPRAKLRSLSLRVGITIRVVIEPVTSVLMSIMTAPAYRKRPQSRSYLANLVQIFAISYSGAARMVAKSNLPPSFRLPAVYAKCAETSSGRGHNGGAAPWSRGRRPALAAVQISSLKSSQRPPSACELSAASTNAMPRAPSSTIGAHSASGSGAAPDCLAARISA